MRQYSRLTLRNLGRVEVIDPLSGETLGQVADLSLGGLRLIAGQPLNEGTSYSLCLLVPDHRDKLYEVPIKATCRWVRQGRRRDTFEVGFALDQPTPAFSDLIGQLMPRRR